MNKAEEYVYQNVLDWRDGKLESGRLLAIIRQAIEFSATERGRQCIAICDYIEQEAASLILNPDSDEGSKQYEKGKGLCAARIRAKIKKLNEKEVTNEKDSQESR